MEGFGDNLHPLETPLILEVIFSNLKLSDLKECRQVCRIWRKESSKAMGAVGKVEVNLDPDGASVYKFLEVVLAQECTLVEAPFANSLAFHDGPVVNPDLWRICGEHVKSLELKKVTFKTTDAFFQLVSERCPKVEHLCLKEIRILGKKRGPKSKTMPKQFSIGSVTSLKCDNGTAMELKKYEVHILEQFSAVENLCVEGDSDGGDELIRSLTSCKDSWNLRKLSWDFGSMDNPEVLLPLLVNSDLSLEGIGVNFSARLESPLDKNAEVMLEELEVIIQILNAQAATLRSLHISGEFFIQAELLFIPDDRIFPKLEKLHIQNLGLGDMKYLNLIPNLKALVVNVSEDLGPSSNINSVYPKVTDLTVSKNDHFLKEATLQLLSRVFPNVENLNLGFSSNQAVAKARQLWPNLKSFTVNGNRNNLVPPKMLEKASKSLAHLQQT